MAELNSNLDQRETLQLHSQSKESYADPSPEQADQTLSPEERRFFGHVFSTADTDSLGVITGDVALRFFPEKTRLPSETLGEVSCKV